jgi:apolipoprotein N-acyltransferase
MKSHRITAMAFFSVDADGCLRVQWIPLGLHWQALGYRPGAGWIFRYMRRNAAKRPSMLPNSIAASLGDESCMPAGHHRNVSFPVSALSTARETGMPHMPPIVLYGLASLAGALSVLGWAPVSWWFFAPAGFAILFYLLLCTRTAWDAAVAGLAFGLGLHLTGHGWFAQVMHDKTGMDWFGAGTATLLFAFYLALFIAVPCLLWRILIRTRTGRASAVAPGAPTPAERLVAVALFASTLALGEWLRSLGFGEFTSLSMGYGLIDTWFAGFAPVLGVYGLSALAYALSGLSVVYLQYRRTSWPVVAVMCLIIASGAVLREVDWVQPYGTPLHYRLVQSEVAQERKFDPLHVPQMISDMVETIEQEPADLIVTPETAFPVFLNQLPGPTLSRLQQFGQQTGSHLFLGIVTLAAAGEGYNTIVHLAPNDRSISQYHKVFLMPLGEYSPPGLGWFAQKLRIPLKDLSSGDAGQPPFSLGMQRIGSLICQEESTGQHLRRWLPGTTLLINPSNMAWFEGTQAIAQRLQIVRMRALEAGRPILRATNGGVTAHIDHHGSVITRLPENGPATLAGVVQPQHGTTPFARFGNSLVVGACLLIVAYAAAKFLRTHSSAVP